MTKIDVSTIAGYADMTAEEKVAALEAAELPEPDYSGYVKKKDFDKASSDLAEAKRQLKAKMTEDEQAAQQRAEEQAELQRKYDELSEKMAVSENKARYLALGYEESLAEETAKALVKGEMDKVFANQKTHQAALEQQVKKDLLKGTPKPEGGTGGPTMTLEELRKLSPADRYTFSVEHPDEYKELYSAKEG